MSTLERVNVGALRKHLGADFDTFICSASYEDRCRAAADIIDPSTLRFALVCENEDLEPRGKRNGTYLRDRFARCLVEGRLSKSRPLKTADSLIEGVTRVVQGGGRNILIDVTTFTHEGLMILLRIASDINIIPGDRNIACVYNLAADYSPGVELEKKWLSRGLREIRSVLGYPGRMLPSREIQLIVLVGFESERAARVIEAYEPSVLSLGLGDKESSATEKLYEVNRHFHGDLVQAFPRFEHFEFSCMDPVMARNQIGAEMERYRDVNVVITPMNTKLSTIGAVLVALRNNDVQLCYAQAEYYNTRSYSVSSDEFIIFGLRETGEYGISR